MSRTYAGARSLHTGRPSVGTLMLARVVMRAAFGRNLAVLLGDLALVQAHRLVATLGPELRELWHELCVELVLGQRGDPDRRRRRAP